MDESSQSFTAVANSPDSRFNGFIPLVLVCASILVVLGWELVVAGQMRSNARSLRDQQTQMVEQSRKVQGSVEKLARDLIELAKTDDDAKALVTKYAISVAAPPAPAASPAASR
jgi:hypothetical protein